MPSIDPDSPKRFVTGIENVWFHYPSQSPCPTAASPLQQEEGVSVQPPAMWLNVLLQRGQSRALLGCVELL